FVDTICWDYQLGVMQFNFDLFLWHYISQLHGENVWSILFKQRGGLTLLLSLLKLLFGLCLFFDLGNDYFISKTHSHRVNSSAGRGWKNIRGIEWAETFISVDLHDFDVGNYTGNRDFYSRIL